jgi:hypothetical protein
VSDQQWQVAGNAAQPYEQRRAARPGLAVDRPQPGFAALAEALDHHVGRAAGAIMRAPFGLSDEAALRALPTGAGFQDVGVERQTGTVRFGSAREC